MWYEILYRVLSIINYIILLIIAIPVLLQVFYILFCWVKKKTFKKSNKLGRIAYVIPAHNEAEVIFDTVSECINKQDYPKDLFDVYVIADNCTDKTVELAKKAGAIVIEHIDTDPSHHMALYPLKYGIEILRKSEKNYDMIVHLDADNHINNEFSKLMNDAFQSGVDFARPYEGAINSTQNFYTKACTIFYTFDSRFGSRVRERLGIAAHINGSGAMMSTRMLNKCGGYDANTISDDAEFNFNRMLEGVKGHFVEDAIVYEDMPSSFKDTLNRNKRIGSGGMKLIKERLLKMVGKFFVTGNFSYIEMFLTYIFNFITILISTWIPLFYIYNFLFLGFATFDASFAATLTMYGGSAYYVSMFWNTIWAIIGVLGGLFVFFGILQGLLLVCLDYKKMGAKKRSELMDAVFLFPLFLILYSVTICIGAFSKPTWGKVNRNAKK
jgi:cellulose synthase/poly-beta-1,6-N-acetylglucosamine synthase-like glycosyltransferase